MIEWKQDKGNHVLMLPCGYLEVRECHGHSDGGATVPYGKIEKPDYMIMVFNSTISCNNQCFWPHSTTLEGAKKVAIERAKQLIDQSKKALGRS